MATSYGWTGKILRVDLTTGNITETPTTDYVPQLVGGRGVAAMIYWEEVPPECGALDPENALIMMTGPASGTLAPANGKFCVTCKSPTPLIETYSYSVPGGHWGPELKFAGYDGLVITGKASEPVYLWIKDGAAEIRSARRLWGMLLSEMMLEIQNLHGPEARVAGIGPAGENLCREAPIIVDREHATGIGGAGAVMGSKNLKAIAVRGTGAVNVAEPKELQDLWWDYFRLVNRKPDEAEYPHMGKSLANILYHMPHMFTCVGIPAPPEDPAADFENKGLDDPICLMADAVNEGTLKIKFGGCYACPVCCGVVYESNNIDIPSGSGQCNDLMSWNDYEWAGYQKVCGIPTTLFNRWTDDLGLSNTNTLGYHFYWFFELVKLGIITTENTGVDLPEVSNPNLTFPIADSPWTEEFIRGVLEGFAYRKTELFDRAAEGQLRFLKSISDEYPAAKPIYDRIAKHKGYFVEWMDIWGSIGGSEDDPVITATDLRPKMVGVTRDPGWPTGFSSAAMKTVSLTPEELSDLTGRGTEKWFSTDPTKNTIILQNYNVNVDCITMCCWANMPPFYSIYTPDYLGDGEAGAKIYSAVTGISTTHEEMMEAMNPVFNLERCIQVREGRRRENDSFNDSVFKSWQATTEDDFNELLDNYYNDPARGWDLETGIPGRSTLEAQGLKKIADELESKYGVTLSA